MSNSAIFLKTSLVSHLAHLSDAILYVTLGTFQETQASVNGHRWCAVCACVSYLIDVLVSLN